MMLIWHVLLGSAILYALWIWIKYVKVRRKVQKFLLKTDGNFFIRENPLSS